MCINICIHLLHTVAHSCVFWTYSLGHAQKLYGPVILCQSTQIPAWMTPKASIMVALRYPSKHGCIAVAIKHSNWGLLKWRCPKMDGLQGKFLSKWMIWGFSHLWKPPIEITHIKFYSWGKHSILEFPAPYDQGLTQLYPAEWLIIRSPMHAVETCQHHK